MTIEQFNEKYSISALVEAIQPVTLTSLEIDEQPLTYGAIDEVISSSNFAVCERATNKEVLMIESDNESHVLKEIISTFNLVESK